MADKHLFFLNEEKTCRLSYDSNQWIIQRAAGKGWHSVKFIADHKDTIELDLFYMEIKPSEEAKKKIKELPDTFLKWRKKHG